MSKAFQILDNRCRVLQTPANLQVDLIQKANIITGQSKQIFQTIIYYLLSFVFLITKSNT